MYVPKHLAPRVTMTRHRTARLTVAALGTAVLGAGALTAAPAQAAPVTAAAPAAALITGFAPSAGVAPSAHVVSRPRYRARTRVAAASVRAGRAVYFASTRRGTPYRWGAAGPRAFDCSGLTQWSFRQAGVRLPRTVLAQYRATIHISQSAKRPGDLIFYHTRSGHVYHVGVYAGNNAVWVARHSGTRITLQRIYTSSYYVGRVR